MSNEETVEIKQSESVSRKRKKNKDYIPTPQQFEVIKDPYARPKVEYKYAKIFLQPNEGTNVEIDKILNSCSSIIKWDEKILEDKTMCLTIIYAVKKNPEEDINNG